MRKQPSIKWRKDDTKELARAVKNFNAKITRLAKKSPGTAAALPEKVSVKELKQVISTRQDLKRELNSLKRFSKKGAEEIVKVPGSEYGLKITKWQKQEMTRRAGVINRKRKARLEEIQATPVKSRGKELGYTKGELGMGKVDEVALKPIKPFTPKMTGTDLKRKYKAIVRESQSTYWLKKEMQLKQNYIDGILQNYKAKDVEDIIKTIEDMPFDEFYKKWLESDEDFTFASAAGMDEENYDSYLNSLRSTWIPNVHTMNKPSAKQRAASGRKRPKR